MGQEVKRSWRALVVGPVTIALALGVTACGTGRDAPSSGPSAPVVTTLATAGAPSGTTTSAPLPSNPLTGIPVYWVGESRRSLALYREFREVPDSGGPIASAVSAMTRLKPLDPDYMTPWRPASRVTVTQKGTAITVDLSRDAFANTQVGSELAARAVQQLVYTATAAAQQAGAPASSVRITVDGAAFDAWGVIRLGAATPRAPRSAVQAQIWITSPQEGEEVPDGTVTFKGFGTSFEANFTWEVRGDSGAVVANGFTMGGSGSSDATYGELTFTAKLKPGSYTVEVSGEDASGGAEGPGAAKDDKSFTVR
jgi:hypothetical protein